VNNAIPSKKNIITVRDEIMYAFEEILFDPLREITGVEIIYNSTGLDSIKKDIMSGNVIFKDGKLLGKFSSDSLKYLNDFKYQGGYIVTDPELLSMLAMLSVSFQKSKESALQFINTFEKIDLGLSPTPFDNLIDDVIKDARKNVNETVLVKTDNQKKDFFVATEKRGIDYLSLILLKLGNDLIRSDNYKYMKSSLDLRYSQTKRKTMVIADDGGFYFGSEARRHFYISQGIEFFEWKTWGDGKVRPSHTVLNGDIFKYNDPPIVDGEARLPGEDYGCRCVDLPIKKVPKIEGGKL